MWYLDVNIGTISMKMKHLIYFFLTTIKVYLGKINVEVICITDKLIKLN